jgi:hypothetical protein
MVEGLIQQTLRYLRSHSSALKRKLSNIFNVFQASIAFTKLDETIPCYSQSELFKGIKRRTVWPMNAKLKKYLLSELAQCTFLVCLGEMCPVKKVSQANNESFQWKNKYMLTAAGRHELF